MGSDNQDAAVQNFPEPNQVISKYEILKIFEKLLQHQSRGRMKLHAPKFFINTICFFRQKPNADKLSVVESCKQLEREARTRKTKRMSMLWN